MKITQLGEKYERLLFISSSSHFSDGKLHAYKRALFTSEIKYGSRTGEG